MSLHFGTTSFRYWSLFAGQDTDSDHRGLEHSADPEEIDDVEKFLNDTIPPLGDQPSL